MTALECYRKGHNVRILERASELSMEGTAMQSHGCVPCPLSLAILPSTLSPQPRSHRSAGDCILMGPSGLSTLKHYPWLKSTYPAIAYDARRSINWVDGTPIVPGRECEWDHPEAPPHPAEEMHVPYMTGRYKLASILEEQLNRLGIRVENNVTIVDYAEHKQRGVGVAVAQDGVGTKSHGVVTGGAWEAKSSGYAALRVSYPTAVARGVESLKELLPKEGERPEAKIFMGYATS